MSTFWVIWSGLVTLFFLLVFSLAYFPQSITVEPILPSVPIAETTQPEVNTMQVVRFFLEEKNSPLADETEFLLTQKHWRLLIAISAIESEYCKRQIAHNCWGIGGDSAYRYYSSYRAAIQDANDFITNWQERGRWLTVEDMNCSYVVPCNENWVRVVNQNLSKLKLIE